MEKERKVKALSIVALIIAVIGLTVAFAALSTTLTINGQAKVQAGTWDVHFAGESGSTDSITAEQIGKGTGTSATLTATQISGVNVTLTKPGDSASYTFYVENNGSIDAKIGSISMDNPTCTPDTLPEGGLETETKVCDNLVYTLKYDGDAESTEEEGSTEGVTGEADSTLAVGNVLPSKTKRKVKLTIGYSMDATKIPSEEVSVQIPEITISYVQN